MKKINHENSGKNYNCDHKSLRRRKKAFKSLRKAYERPTIGHERLRKATKGHERPRKATKGYERLRKVPFVKGYE
jgi:hypothetical protein